MPYNYIDETGVIVPDTADLKTEVQDEYKATFGDDIDLDDETPEGALISAETASRSGVSTNNAALANQINPNLSGGIFLDSLWNLTGGARSGNDRSTFTSPPLLTGVPSTIIPAGSIAKTAAGDEFSSVGAIVLDANGDGSVNFQSVETGEIVALAGTLISIVSGVLGWETITNPVDATLGSEQQSDISGRLERNETLALQGSGLTEAIFSRVRAVAGVNSLSFRENITDAPIVIDGVNLVEHSIWACVDGGTDEDVATALIESKDGGCDWNNGNSSIPVTFPYVDPISGQSYDVEFDRPDDVPMLYSVTIKPGTVTDAANITKQAILAYADGEIDGEKGLVVGADVSPWEAAGAVNVVEPRITVTKVEVKKVSGGVFTTDTIAIELFEKASIDINSISVTQI